jgi:hypothetical protein
VICRLNTNRPWVTAHLQKTHVQVAVLWVLTTCTDYWRGSIPSFPRTLPPDLHNLQGVITPKPRLESLSPWKQASNLKQGTSSPEWHPLKVNLPTEELVPRFVTMDLLRNQFYMHEVRLWSSWNDCIASILRGVTLSSYALRPKMLPLLEIFLELLMWNSSQYRRHNFFMSSISWKYSSL